MKSVLTVLGQMIVQVLVFLLFFFVLGYVAVVARNSVAAASKFHWLAGAFVGALWLIGVLTLCFSIWYAMRPSAPRWLRDNVLIRGKTDGGLVEQFPAASLSALICVAMLTAVFVLTLVSAGLASQGLLTYASESVHDQPMTELLFRLYIWHTVDMIPFIDVWKVYDIKPAIRPTNFLAQSIVLVFRTAIIGFAISVIAQWLKFNRDLSGQNEKT